MHAQTPLGTVSGLAVDASGGAVTAASETLTNNDTGVRRSTASNSSGAYAFPEIMSIFQRLNRDSGITMIVVTHDSEIAAYASRNIHLCDGRLQKDMRTASPRDAAQELRALPAEEEEEDLASRGAARELVSPGSGNERRLGST